MIIAPQEPRWAVLARVLRAQGRRGEVLAELLTSFPEKFAERQRVTLVPDADAANGREIDIEAHWFPQGRKAGNIVLKFAGVDSISAADELRTLLVAVPWSRRAALDADEFYVADLAGCTVVADGRELGVVQDVDMASTSLPLLVVRAADGEEHLLPLAKAFLTSVDTVARRIVMTLPEGLLEINKP